MVNENNQKGLNPANGISPNFYLFKKVLSDTNKIKTEIVLLVVPSESVSAYKSAGTWKDFTNIIGKDLSGVEETLVDDVDTPAEYYNLNGVRVENPENGVYIKRQGGKATKVVM